MAGRVNVRAREPGMTRDMQDWLVAGGAGKKLTIMQTLPIFYSLSSYLAVLGRSLPSHTDQYHYSD